MRFGLFSSPAPNVRFCIKNYIKCVLDGVTPPIFSFQLEWGPRTFSARLFYGVTPPIKVQAQGGVIPKVANDLGHVGPPKMRPNMGPNMSPKMSLKMISKASASLLEPAQLRPAP